MEVVKLQVIKWSLCLEHIETLPVFLQRVFMNPSETHLTFESIALPYHLVCICFDEELGSLLLGVIATEFIDEEFRDVSLGQIVLELGNVNEFFSEFGFEELENVN